jgi:hypothetical protein
MARRKLTSQFLNSNLESGRYYDDGGAGLNLHVRNSGSKNWSQKIRFQGKQYELGLGSFPMVSLAEARSIAAQNKSNVGKGINPKFEASAPKMIPTFSEISELVVTLKHNELSNEKHKAQWSSTLARYAYPILANIPVNLITVDHVLQALEPIWLTKNVTARRTRSRIETVLNYAIVKKYARAKPSRVAGQPIRIIAIITKRSWRKPHASVATQRCPSLVVRIAKSQWYRCKRPENVDFNRSAIRRSPRYDLGRNTRL